MIKRTLLLGGLVASGEGGEEEREEEREGGERGERGEGGDGAEHEVRIARRTPPQTQEGPRPREGGASLPPTPRELRSGDDDRGYQR